MIKNRQKRFNNFFENKNDDLGVQEFENNIVPDMNSAPSNLVKKIRSILL